MKALRIGNTMLEVLCSISDWDTIYPGGFVIFLSISRKMACYHIA
jgi:hypothetical protein